MLKPIHSRLARAALRWSLVDLEAKTGISKNTLVRFESGGGVHHSTAIKIEDSFAQAGISFIYEDETRGAGILLSKDLSRRVGQSPDGIAKGKVKKRKAR